MKRPNQRLLQTNLLLLLLFPLLATAAESESVWKDGFLEREYPVTMADINHAQARLCPKCIPKAVQLLDKVEIDILGVGDSQGRYGMGGGRQMWRGVSTIDALDVPPGGMDIQVKKIPGKQSVTVGFRVPADKRSAAVLHRLLHRALQK